VEKIERMKPEDRPTTVEGWADLIEAGLEEMGKIGFLAEDLSGQERERVDQEVFRRAAASVEARKLLGSEDH
jgi:hypothetical protein